MFTVESQQLTGLVVKPGQGQSIRGTKRRDVFLPPSRSFDSYFREIVPAGRA